MCALVEREHILRKNDIAAQNVTWDMGKRGLAGKAVRFLQHDFKFEGHDMGDQRAAASVDCDTGNLPRSVMPRASANSALNIVLVLPLSKRAKKCGVLF